MRLSLKNINIVGNADIKLDGLTVIAGENGTGKSTVGKVLFSIINAISNVGPSQKSYKDIKLRKYVESLYQRISVVRLTRESQLFDDLFPIPSIRLVHKFMDIYNDELLDERLKSDQYETILSNMSSCIDSMEELSPRMKQLAFSDINNINILLKETDNFAADLLTEINYLIESEFMNHICSLGTDSSEICLSIDGITNDIELKFDNDHINSTGLNSHITNEFKDATYVESPLYMHILDSLLGSTDFREVQARGQSIIRRAMLPIHIKDIALKINSASLIGDDQIQNLKVDAGGAFVFKEGRLYYQKDGVLYSPINVASGLKSFGLIQLLMEIDCINEKKMLIWDEPENHLHPKWQIQFASVLVELAKMGVPILISTHSPYFVQGIRYYATKMKIDKFVNYYLADKKEGESLSTLEDVTTDLNRIFYKLATPLNEIMNIE